MVGIKGKSGVYKRKPFTEEHKRNISEGHKNHSCYKNPERGEKIRNSLKGRKLSESHIKNLRTTHLGEKHSPERILNAINARRENGWYKDTEKTKDTMRIKRIEIMRNGIRQKETKPEKAMKEILIDNNIIFKEQWNYKYGIADFYLPEHNIVLEVDGEYWHSRPEVKERDVRQTKYLENCGYNVVRLTDKEILSGNIKQIIEVNENERRRIN